MTERFILICDDEVELAEELGEFFEALGWTIRVCRSGLEARQTLESGLVPDCLLTDLNMNNFSGADLIAYARALPEQQRPRLTVVMTGNQALQIGPAELGCDLLRFKPIDPVALTKDLEGRVGAPTPPPAVPASMNRTEQALLEADRLQRSILVIDDDLAIQEELCESLNAASYRAFSPQQGQDLATTRLEDVDIVVLDLMMPKIDGIDILKHLSGLEAPPPVIIISGHGEGVLRAASCAAECEGVRILGALSKPLDMARLITLIESSVDGVIHVPRDARSEEDLAPAIIDALDSGSLAIAFQPLVSADSLEFVGAEALLTAELAGFGPVSPIALIAAAGTVPGLLVRLTYRVMHLASAACAAWNGAGWTGAVSVNVPLEVLLSDGAVSNILEIVKSAGLQPQQMLLELTEDAIYDSSGDALAVLAKLRLAGFGLALDDVGRRQSGLLQLANLPVTEIKIDLEIIRQARKWVKFRSIFESIARLGPSLNVLVVAEGIETMDDLDLARSCHVNYIQGFLISRKVAFDDLLKLLPHIHEPVVSAS